MHTYNVFEWDNVKLIYVIKMSSFTKKLAGITSAELCENHKLITLRLPQR